MDTQIRQLLRSDSDQDIILNLVITLEAVLLGDVLKPKTLNFRGMKILIIFHVVRPTERAH